MPRVRRRPPPAPHTSRTGVRGSEASGGGDGDSSSGDDGDSGDERYPPKFIPELLCAPRRVRPRNPAVGQTVLQCTHQAIRAMPRPRQWDKRGPPHIDSIQEQNELAAERLELLRPRGSVEARSRERRHANIRFRESLPGWGNRVWLALPPPFERRTSGVGVGAGAGAPPTLLSAPTAAAAPRAGAGAKPPGGGAADLPPPPAALPPKPLPPLRRAPPRPAVAEPSVAAAAGWQFREPRPGAPQHRRKEGDGRICIVPATGPGPANAALAPIRVAPRAVGFRVQYM